MLPGKKLTPLDLLRIARRRAWLILLPPAVTLFVALIWASKVPNLYESDMLIAIDPQRVPDTFVRSTVTLGTDVRMDAISVQVMSRTSLERIIQALNLYPDERAVLPMEDVVALMRQNIFVELERTQGREGGAHAFHVRFTHPDPQVAAEVTQQLGSLYVAQNVQDRNARAESTNRFLETQLAEARQNLEAQERRLEAFRQRHGKELPTQMQTNMQANTNAQLQVQSMVESIARDRDRKQLLERLYQDAAAAPLPTVPTSAAPAGGAGPTVATDASAQQQLAAARASLASLETRYKPDHPDVRRAKSLIATLEPKAAAEAAGGTPQIAAGASEAEIRRRERLDQMTAEIESLSRQISFKEAAERRLRDETAEYQRRIEAVPGLESEWVALTRDYETQQAAYKDLLAKSGASKVAVDLEQQQIGEHFRIVDPAGVPVHPRPSIRIRINAGGLGLGLLIGLGIAALLEYKDESFRSDAEIMDLLGFPVLASVPYIATTAVRVQQRRRTLWLSAAGAVCLAAVCYVTWTMKLWNSLT